MKYERDLRRAVFQNPSGMEFPESALFSMNGGDLLKQLDERAKEGQVE
jgi:hypothetical protein